MHIKPMPIFSASVFIIIAIILAGFFLPDKKTVTRTITIDAEREDVFRLVSDYREWNRWSPWAKIDPNADFIIEGSGVGQTMRWVSDHPKVGTGTQIIAALSYPNQVRSELNFNNKGMATATLRLSNDEADRSHTIVNWEMETNMRDGVPLWMQPLATYAGFFMDHLLGPDYEKGLKNLKTVAEQEPKTSYEQHTE